MRANRMHAKYKVSRDINTLSKQNWSGKELEGRSSRNEPSLSGRSKSANEEKKNLSGHRRRNLRLFGRYAYLELLACLRNGCAECFNPGEAVIYGLCRQVDHNVGGFGHQDKVRRVFGRFYGGKHRQLEVASSYINLRRRTEDCQSKETTFGVRQPHAATFVRDLREAKRGRKYRQKHTTRWYEEY